MRLTASVIKTLTLPKGRTDHIHFDERLPGFGLRLRASGDKSFVYQYAIAGRTRKFTIGKIDPGKAFDIAKDLYAQVRLGRDPVVEKKQSRIRAAETMGAMLPLYLGHKRDRLRPSTLVQVVRNLENYARPLHLSPIASIDRRTIATLLLTVTERNGPRAAFALRRDLRTFFGWAAREGLVEHNEAAYTNAPTVNEPRTRVLSGDELRIIWNALEDDALNDAFLKFAVLRDAVKLLMLTACRRNEIARLSWGEVDLTAKQLNLPPERTKNKKPHKVPLAPQAIEILMAQPRSPDQELVFPAARSGKFIEIGDYLKKTLDKRILAREWKSLEPWVWHDFRRAASTWMHENGVTPHIVEAVLAHHAGGVAAVYNRAEYIIEKRRALSLWADFVTGESTGKVVTLRA
jgi:integrase